MVFLVVLRLAPQIGRLIFTPRVSHFETTLKFCCSTVVVVVTACSSTLPPYTSKLFSNFMLKDKGVVSLLRYNEYVPRDPLNRKPCDTKIPSLKILRLSPVMQVID